MGHVSNPPVPSPDHTVHPLEKWVDRVTAIAQTIIGTGTLSRTEAIRSIVNAMPPASSRAEQLVAHGLLVELLLGTTTSRSDLLAQLDRLSSHAPAEEAASLIGRIAMRIVEQCREPLDSRRLARDYAMDESTLRKEFKRHVGVTPREYHLRARVSLALDLLRSGDHKIGWIARHVGYREEKNFFRAVRRFTGRTPGQLRLLSDEALRSMARDLLGSRRRMAAAAPRVIERRRSSPRRRSDREIGLRAAPTTMSDLLSAASQPCPRSDTLPGSGKSDDRSACFLTSST